MATTDDEIKVNLTIDEKTVIKCLRIIEIWLNDNPDKVIDGGIRKLDGSIDGFKIRRRDKTECKN